MHLINPIGKRFAYGVNTGPLGTPHLDLPPWKGTDPSTRMAGRGAAISITSPVDTPEFAEAHVFGAVRFVLDIWERYFGRHDPVAFRARLPPAGNRHLAGHRQCAMPATASWKWAPITAAMAN